MTDLGLNSFLVFLYLNMTSKEIANILHVYSLAVEQTRYRLRKKFSLAPNENLQDFLMRLDQ